jgi:hypothetical protein
MRLIALLSAVLLSACSTPQARYVVKSIEPAKPQRHVKYVPDGIFNKRFGEWKRTDVEAWSPVR